MNNSRSSYKGILVQITVNIVILILGALLGFYVQGIRSDAEDERANKIRDLEYRVSKQPAIILPSVRGKKLEVLLDKKPVESISQITVRIYNNSDRDFEGVPIYITLKPTTGTNLQIVGESAVGPNEFPDAATPMANLSPTSDSTEKRFGYLVGTLNRSNYVEPQFSVTYVILGKDFPSVDIQTNKKGVNLRDFSTTISEIDRSWSYRLLRFFLTPYGIAAYFLMISIPLALWSRKKERQSDEALFKAFEALVSKSEVNERLKSGEGPVVLTQFLREEMPRIRWAETPWLFKAFTNKPK